jgi:hypothetical protein
MGDRDIDHEYISFALFAALLFPQFSCTFIIPVLSNQIWLMVVLLPQILRNLDLGQYSWHEIIEAAVVHAFENCLVSELDDDPLSPAPDDLLICVPGGNPVGEQAFDAI